MGGSATAARSRTATNIGGITEASFGRVTSLRPSAQALGTGQPPWRGLRGRRPRSSRQVLDRVAMERASRQRSSSPVGPSASTAASTACPVGHRPHEKHLNAGDSQHPPAPAFDLPLEPASHNVPVLGQLVSASRRIWSTPLGRPSNSRNPVPNGIDNTPAPWRGPQRLVTFLDGVSEEHRCHASLRAARAETSDGVGVASCRIRLFQYSSLRVDDGSEPRSPCA